MGHYAAELGSSEESYEEQRYQERKHREDRNRGKELFDTFMEKYAKEKKLIVSPRDIVKIHPALCKQHPTHDQLFHYSKNGEQFSDARIFPWSYARMSWLGIETTPYEQRLYTVLLQNEDSIVVNPATRQHKKKPELSMHKNQQDRKNIRYFDKRIFIKAYSADTRKTFIQEAIGDYTTKNKLITLIKRDKISAETINKILQQNKKK